MDIVFFKTASRFRQWLKANHGTVRELWVGFYKKSVCKPGITYPEALDEALCFGWIDGVRKSMEAEAYTQRFTPRKPGSRWSAVNIARVEALLKAGRMHSAGLHAFEGARNQARTYSYEQRREAVLGPTMRREFRANPKAWDFFEAQPPWYRRTCAFWVLSAKKEETRKRRLQTLISDSSRGQAVKPLRRSPVPKRHQKMQ